MLALRQRSTGLRPRTSSGPRQLLYVWSLRPKSGKKSHKLGYPDIGRAVRLSQDCGGWHTDRPRPDCHRGRAAPRRTAQEAVRTRYDPPQAENPHCAPTQMNTGPFSDTHLMHAPRGMQGRHGHDRRGPRPPPSRPLRTVTDRYSRYKHASLHKNAGAALD